MRYTFMSDNYAAVKNDVCYIDQNEDYCGEAIDKLAAYEDAEEKGYIITPPDSGINVYIIDKNGDINKGNISKTNNIKDFLFDYAISIDNTTM